jgi:hypothetical protein
MQDCYNLFCTTLTLTEMKAKPSSVISRLVVKCIYRKKISGLCCCLLFYSYMYCKVGQKTIGRLLGPEWFSLSKPVDHVKSPGRLVIRHHVTCRT